MGALEVSFKKSGAAGVLYLSGDLDINSSSLVEKVGWALENGYKNLVCDFQEVNMVDYAGMSALAIAYKNVINHEGVMKFSAVSLHIRKIFNLVCLDRVFDFYDNLDLALRSFDDDRDMSEIQKKRLRRRFKRLPLDIDVKFKSRGEKDFHHGKVLNISGVGLLVFTENTAYPLGDIMDIQLTLKPSPGQLDMEAKVVWLVEKKIQPQIYPAVGLEFYHLDSAIQERIVQFVERNLALDCADDD